MVITRVYRAILKQLALHIQYWTLALPKLLVFPSRGAVLTWNAYSECAVRGNQVVAKRQNRGSASEFRTSINLLAAAKHQQLHPFFVPSWPMSICSISRCNILQLQIQACSISRSHFSKGLRYNTWMLCYKVPNNYNGINLRKPDSQVQVQKLQGFKRNTGSSYIAWQQYLKLRP